MLYRSRNRLEHLLVLCIGLLFSDGAGASNPSGHTSETDPLRLYGEKLVFKVQRDGKAAGHHLVRFVRDGNGLIVESEFRLAIEFLSIPVYRFIYRSFGTWRDRRLAHLTAEIDDNGKKTVVEAITSGDTTTVQRIGPGAEAARVTATGSLFPTTHWNRAVVMEPRVLNTLTGRINTVRIEPQEVDDVPTERGAVAATRFVYSGDLQTEVWYDDDGRWVKMRFQGRDGSTIEYLCQRCQGPRTGAADG